MTYESVGFGILVACALALATVLSRRSGSRFPERLVMIAVALRVIGSVVRYEMLERLYNGVGDAAGYYGRGERLAAEIWSGSLSPFSGYYWSEMYVGFGDRIWGTPFMIRLSGIVVAVIGPSMRGEFLFFALLAFLGTYWIAQSAQRVQPGERAVAFAAWMWLWPSVWFWPSSVGKEALVLFAVGLATLGYTGDGRRIRPVPYALGLALAFLVRPHVAVVIALATVAGIWFASARTWTPRRVVEAVAFLGVAVLALGGMQAQFGMEQLDAEGISALIASRAEMTDMGGSTIGQGPAGLLGIPMAFINVWLRPFPWDVHNAQAVLAAVEAVVLWWLIWTRRRELLLAIRHWRSHRLLRFAGPFLALYTIMIGLGFSNLGLIARQRAPLFPFLLLFIFAVPDLAKSRSTTALPRALSSRPRPEATPSAAPIAPR